MALGRIEDPLGELAERDCERALAAAEAAAELAGASTGEGPAWLEPLREGLIERHLNALEAALAKLGTTSELLAEAGLEGRLLRRLLQRGLGAWEGRLAERGAALRGSRPGLGAR